MMTTEQFCNLILSLISAIGIVITAYVVPLIKANVTQSQLEQLEYYVSLAVRCAEQIYNPEQWVEKKKYVVEYVMNVVNSKLKIDMDEQDINTIVEGIVNAVKHDGDVKTIDGEK